MPLDGIVDDETWSPSGIVVVDNAAMGEIVDGGVTCLSLGGIDICNDDATGGSLGRIVACGWMGGMVIGKDDVTLGEIDADATEIGVAVDPESLLPNVGTMVAS